MVGAVGFEPTTSWSRTKRATKLRYAPPTICQPEWRGGDLIATVIVLNKTIYRALAVFALALPLASAASR